MEGLALWQNAFGDALAGAAGRILPHAEGLVWVFFAFGAVGLIWQAANGRLSALSILKAAATLIIVSGSIVFIERNATDIKEAIISSGVTLGVNAGNTGINANQFIFSPMAMMQRGFLKAIEIWGIAGNSCPPIYLGGCMSSLPLAGPMFAVSLVIMLTYTAVAYRIVMAFVKAALGMLVAMPLLPASALPSLRALGWSPAFYMFNQALALLAMALVVSVGDRVIGNVAVDPQSFGLSGAAAFAVASYFLWKSANEAPNIVREILSSVVAPAGQSLAGTIGKTVQAGLIGKGTQAALTTLGKTGSNPPIGVLRAIGSASSGFGGGSGRGNAMPSGITMTRNFGGPIYQGGARQAQLAAAMKVFPRKNGLEK